MPTKCKGRAQDPSAAKLGQELGPPLPGGSRVPVTVSHGHGKDENGNVTMLNLNLPTPEGPFEKSSIHVCYGW